MITTGIPYAPDGNLGRAYNRFMEKLNGDEWACFLDHDAMFTTSQWYRQLDEVVRREDPNKVGLLTGVANRTGAKWQRAPDTNPRSHDVAYHRRLGAQLLERHRAAAVDVTDRFPLGGYVMCLSKRAWSRAKGFVDGMYCVDHNIHLAVKRAGMRVLLLPGLYVYHWRRAAGEHASPDPKLVARCPCRTIRNI